MIKDVLAGLTIRILAPEVARENGKIESLKKEIETILSKDAKAVKMDVLIQESQDLLSNVLLVSGINLEGYTQEKVFKVVDRLFSTPKWQEMHKALTSTPGLKEKWDIYFMHLTKMALAYGAFLKKYDK